MIKRILWAALPMGVVFIFDNLVSVPSGLYEWWWFDIFMHLLGGLVVAWSANRFFKGEKSLSISPEWVYYLLIIGIVALVGIVWEVYEYFVQQITGSIIQPSIADTVADLVNDCLGALVFTTLSFWVKVRGKRRG